MHKVRQFVFLLAAVLFAGTALASQIAILKNGFSIRHERRAAMGDLTRLYTGADASSYVDIPTGDIDHFEIDTTPAPQLGSSVPSAALPAPTSATAPVPATSAKIDQIVDQASEAHKIDPDFINSVIRAESGFNVRAVSPKGAQGLMQLMPGTATNLGVNNAFDPQANVDGGTRYLRFLLEKYNYDVAKALAAYNAGPQRVDHYHGIPPYYETRAYVARIIRDYNRKKLAEQKAAKAQQTVTTTRVQTRITSKSRPGSQARSQAALAGSAR